MLAVILFPLLVFPVRLYSSEGTTQADMNFGADRHFAYADAALRDAEPLRAESEYRAGISEALAWLGARELARGNSSSAKEIFIEAARIVATPSPKLQPYLKNEKNSDSTSPANGPQSGRIKSNAVASSAEAKIEDRIRIDVATAYFNLGLMHGKQDRFRDAAAFFGRAAYWGPDLANVEYSLGLALFNAKEYNKAVPPLQRALVQDPSNVPARKQLALACYRAQDYGCVIVALSDHSELLHDRQVGYIAGYVLAVSLTRSGRPEEGERLLSELLNQYADSAEFLVLVGEGYAHQNDDSRALPVLRRAIQVNPSILEAHSTAALIYLRTGEFDEAEKEFREELKVNPSDSTTSANLAFVLSLQQKDDEAVFLLKKILQAQPNSAEAHYTLAKILADHDELPLAFGHAQTAVQLSPEDERKHYQLAQICAKLGRSDEAQSQLATYRQLTEKSRTTP